MNLVESLAAVVALGGMLAAGLVLIGTHSVMLAVATLLDFLVATTLLRLAGEPSWPSLGETAAILVVRQVIRAGLGFAEPGREG